MAEIDSLSIQIKSSANAASSAIDKLIKKLETLQGIAGSGKITVFVDEIHSASNGMNSLANSTKNATSALVSFLAKLTSVYSMFRLLKYAVKESMNYTESFEYFNVAMKQYTQDALDYAQKVNNAFGIDLTKWENMQATFMSLNTGFGVTADKAYLMSKNLTQLAWDWEALKEYGDDAATSFQKLRSAMAAEIEPVRDFGIDLSKANLMLIAHELGITKAFNAMTQAEKAQLRYIAIMRGSTIAMGEFNRQLEHPAVQLSVFKQQLVQCARALGNIFIPLISAALPYLIAFAKAVRVVLEMIAKLFGFSYPEVKWTGEYSAGVDDIADSLDNATGKAKKLHKQLAGFDEINNLTTTSGGRGVGGIGAGGFGDLDLPEYDFLGDAADKIDRIKEAISAVLPMIVALGVAIGVIIIGYNWSSIIATGKKLLDGLTFGVQFFWEVLKANPIATIIAAISLVIGILATLYNNNEDFRVWVENAWARFKQIVSAFKEKFLTIQSVAKGVWDNIKSVWKNAPTWFSSTWQTLVTNVKGKWKTFKEAAKNAWEGIKNVFSKIPTWFKDKFTAAWTAVKKVFSTGGKVFDGIKDGIVTAFKTVVNAIIGGINKVIAVPFNKIKEILTKIKNIDIMGIKPFSNLNVSWTVPQIPKLATGGIITSPTLAMVGESGAEAVVPLENNTEWINKVAAQINAKTDNDDVVKALEVLIEVVSNKELVIDSKSLARGVSNEINRQTRILGEGMVY